MTTFERDLKACEDNLEKINNNIIRCEHDLLDTMSNFHWRTNQIYEKLNIYKTQRDQTQELMHYIKNDTDRKERSYELLECAPMY